MAQQSARRDQENQGFPPCLEHALGDLDRIRELPYRPATARRRTTGRTDGSIRLRVRQSRIYSCAEGASTDGKRTRPFQTRPPRVAFGPLSSANPALIPGAVRVRCPDHTWGLPWSAQPNVSPKSKTWNDGPLLALWACGLNGPLRPLTGRRWKIPHGGMRASCRRPSIRRYRSAPLSRPQWVEAV